MAKIKRLSDFTDLNEDFVTECREAVTKFEEFMKEYVDLQDLEVIPQIEAMENLKRRHGSFLTYSLRFFSQVQMYKENAEFMSAERKQLKSQTIEELIKKGNNATTAERIVYSDVSYVENLKHIQEIRKFLIYISENYDLHKNIISRSIHQSLSTLQKEAESLKRTQ